MKRLVVGAVSAGVVAASLLAVGTTASAGEVLLVDDDGLQCATEITSISAALDLASNGDTIQVCPGRYVVDADNAINVSKSVSIIGPVEALTDVDCTALAPAELDLTRFAVVEPRVPTREATNSLVTLNADNIELAGLVLQGVHDDTPQLVTGINGEFTVFNPALSSSDDHSGYWIHHNLIRLNKHGVELGSSGAATSRVDHNCMQENRFAVANQREELTDAVIESNVTFRTFAAAYEIGWGLAGTKDVNLRHNQSIEDNRAYVVEESQDTNLYDNTVSRARDVGVEILGGNEDVRVSGNTIAAGGANFIGGSGIALRAPRTSFPQQPSTDVLVASNTITGFRTAGNAGFGMNVNSGSTAGATIVDNVLSGNGVAGLQVGNRNTGSLIRGNVASDNAQFGIRVMATAIDNTFVDNQMSGNATDARDDTDANLADGVQLLNRWTGNQCLSDIPVGAICGVA